MIYAVFENRFREPQDELYLILRRKGGVGEDACRMRIRDLNPLLDRDAALERINGDDSAKLLSVLSK
jgi:hypothetical protein